MDYLGEVGKVSTGRGNGTCKDPETRGPLEQSLDVCERKARNELVEQGEDLREVT